MRVHFFAKNFTIIYFLQRKPLNGYSGLIFRWGLSFEPRLADSLEGTNSSVDLQPEYPLPLLVITLFNQNSCARNRWGHNLIAMEVSVCSSEVRLIQAGKTGAFFGCLEVLLSPVYLFLREALLHHHQTQWLTWCVDVLSFFFFFALDGTNVCKESPSVMGKWVLRVPRCPLLTRGGITANFTRTKICSAHLKVPDRIFMNKKVLKCEHFFPFWSKSSSRSKWRVGHGQFAKLEEKM